MTNEIIKPEPNQTPSFEDFKEIILRYGANSNVLNWAATEYGRIPGAIRALSNFDPTGISGAIDQLFSEKVSEREQDNILRAMYMLASRIWKIESKVAEKLPDEKFRFLYVVYKMSKTDIQLRVDADSVQNVAGVSQNRAISIGQYLDEKGYIKFRNWFEGIWILHDGIIKVESELLNNRLPEYVDENEVPSINMRMRRRYSLLQDIYMLSGDTSLHKVRHEDLADYSKIDHQTVINELLPYLGGEGWIRFATADTVKITEDGIDFARGLKN